MAPTLDDGALDIVFRGARSYRHWHDRVLADSLPRAIYELARLGPTSANCQPGRFTFVVSPAAKARLAPCLAAGNVDKTMSAAATAIVAHDLDFHERMANASMAAGFAADPAGAEVHAFRNGTLEGAYFIVAARALGLDCGPMSGFDNDMVDAEFFPDSRVKSNFLINLGYGEAAGMPARGPRHDFEVACAIL